MSFGWNNMSEEERAYARQRAEEVRFQSKTRFCIKDDMYIGVDQYNYILQKKNKDGSFSDMTYHSDLASALTSYNEYMVRKAILNAPDGDVADLIAIVKTEKDRQADSVKKLLEIVDCTVRPAVSEAEVAEEDTESEE